MVGFKIFLSGTAPKTEERAVYKTREGQAMLVDEAFIAWTTGTLDQMLQAVLTKTHVIDRHFLLQRIVRETYKLRKDKYYRDLCLKHAQLHFTEFDTIAPVLKREMNGVLPRITTFQQHATILVEMGMHDQAIKICERAIQYGLHDGTQSGFAGRIARIRKRVENTHRK